MSQIPPTPHVPDDNAAAAEKVRSFPHTPGVYLMKDAAGRVIYIGKAKNLRARAGSYFLKAAAENSRTAQLVAGNPRHRLPRRRERGRRPADGSPADQGHPAQVQPRPPRRQDLSLPGNPHPRGFSPRGNHPHAASRGARSSTGRSPTPAACAGPCRSCRRSSSSAPARWTSTDDDPRWRWFRPCLLASIRPMHGPLQLADLQGGVPQEHPPLAAVPGRQEANAAGRDARRDGRGRRSDCSSRRRPGSATRSICWRRSTSAASSTRTCSRRSFPSIPRKGLAGLQKVLAPGASRRGRSRASTSPTPPARKRWPAWCSSSTACRSSRAIGGCGSARSRASTTWPASTRPCSRRFHRLAEDGESDSLPDILLIDGGKGQLARGPRALDAPGRAAARRSFRWPSARK